MMEHEKRILITLPYQRQCMNPRVAAYLQRIEAEMNRPERLKAMQAEAGEKLHDLMVYGTCSWKSGSAS